MLPTLYTAILPTQNSVNYIHLSTSSATAQRISTTGLHRSNPNRSKQSLCWAWKLRWLSRRCSSCNISKTSLTHTNLGWVGRLIWLNLAVLAKANSFKFQHQGYAAEETNLSTNPFKGRNTRSTARPHCFTPFEKYLQNISNSIVQVSTWGQLSSPQRRWWTDLWKLHLPLGISYP